MKKQEKAEAYNSDITSEDLQALGNEAGNLRKDGGRDQQLRDRKENVDFAGNDLDIPGRKSQQEKNGLKDEENQHYSLGSDQNAGLR